MRAGLGRSRQGTARRGQDGCGDRPPSPTQDSIMHRRATSVEYGTLSSDRRSPHLRLGAAGLLAICGGACFGAAIGLSSTATSFLHAPHIRSPVTTRQPLLPRTPVYSTRHPVTLARATEKDATEYANSALYSAQSAMSASIVCCTPSPQPPPTLESDYAPKGEKQARCADPAHAAHARCVRGGCATSPHPESFLGT